MVCVLKGFESRDLYLKGSSPFIDHSGSHNYSTITLQLRLSYMECGPRLKILACRAHSKLPDCLLGSRTSTWLVPRTAFEAVTILIYFA
jgi:hypothetical protein